MPLSLVTPVTFNEPVTVRVDVGAPKLELPTIRLPVVVAEAVVVMPAPLAVVSMTKILLPEPSWTARAVVLAMFMSRPPLAVKPARKALLLLCSSIRLLV